MKRIILAVSVIAAASCLNTVGAASADPQDVDSMTILALVHSKGPTWICDTLSPQSIFQQAPTTEGKVRLEMANLTHNYAMTENDAARAIKIATVGYCPQYEKAVFSTLGVTEPSAAG